MPSSLPSHSSPRSEGIDSLEKRIARDLLELSLNDRNTINEEIHGVLCVAPEESPELLHKSIQDFWVAVSALPDSQTKAYRECKRIANANRSHPRKRNHYAIDDPNFPLRFLRCELFDVQKAALRYTNYLNFVHELWGKIALEREIRFSDFSKEEAKQFRKGYYQLLPIRDQSGRRVMVMHRNMCNKSADVIWIKVVFYLWNAIAFKDIESQRKGAVAVGDICACGDTTESMQKRLERIQLYSKAFSAIPTRLVVHHFSVPTTGMAMFIRHIMNMDFGSKSQQVRFRIHLKNNCKGEAETTSCNCCGGGIYIRYHLRSYGIPTDLLPYTDSGTMTNKHHLIWTRSRKYFENGAFEVDDAHDFGNGSVKVLFPDRPKAVLIVDCPASNDVLFRQGKNMMEHPGNAMFRDLILDYLERDKAFKANKAIFVGTEGGGGPSSSSSETTETMKQHGKHWFVNSWILNEIYVRRKGRFLEWDRDRCVWTVMKDLQVIKHKISVVYAKYRNKQESLSKNVTNSTATTTKQRKRFPIDSSGDNVRNDDSDTMALMPYQFIDGRMTTEASSCRNVCGFIHCNKQASSSPWDARSNPTPGTIPPEDGFAPALGLPSASSNPKKRARDTELPDMELPGASEPLLDAELLMKLPILDMELPVALEPSEEEEHKI